MTNYTEMKQIIQP